MDSSELVMHVRSLLFDRGACTTDQSLSIVCFSCLCKVILHGNQML